MLGGCGLKWAWLTRRPPNSRQLRREVREEKMQTDATQSDDALEEQGERRGRERGSDRQLID